MSILCPCLFCTNLSFLSLLSLWFEIWYSEIYFAQLVSCLVVTTKKEFRSHRRGWDLLETTGTLCPPAKKVLGRVKMDYRGPAFDQSGWLRWCKPAGRRKGCFSASSEVLRLGRILGVKTGEELLRKARQQFVGKHWVSSPFMVSAKRSCTVGTMKWGSICWERMKLGGEPLGPKFFVEMDFWRFPNESVQTNEGDDETRV